MSFSSLATCALVITLGAILAQTQEVTPAAHSGVTVTTENLPKALLWMPYRSRLQASGGIEPYHWQLVGGSLPRGWKLDSSGELTGVPEEISDVELNLLVSDSDRPPKQYKQKVRLVTETPLIAKWDRKAGVNGQRIDGSIKVSNHTGRDFDLTVIILAVNDIGRATAIGYQHFPLKKDTHDLGIAFGDTLSPGNYVVNVDVVGEEPVSNRVFRARLVTGKEQVAQGP
jgi:hypothetical protein